MKGGTKRKGEMDLMQREKEEISCVCDKRNKEELVKRRKRKVSRKWTGEEGKILRKERWKECEEKTMIRKKKGVF